MREYKHYGLKHTKRPAKSTLLLTTAQVMNESGVKGYCYLSFSDKLIKYVGLALSKGLSADNPAILSILFTERKVWEVYAQYVSSTESVLLWETKTSDTPVWLKFIKARSK